MKFSFFKWSQEVDTDTKQAVKPLNNPVKIDITELNPTAKIKNIPLYNKILFVLNSSIYFMTNGQMDFRKLKSTNFSFDESKYTHLEVKQMFDLCDMFYQHSFGTNKLNNMIALTNSMNEIHNKLLTNYVGGNIKPTLLTLLNQAKSEK